MSGIHEYLRGVGSKRAVQPVNDLRAAPVYSIFKDKKLKGSDKVMVKQIIA